MFKYLRRFIPAIQYTLKEYHNLMGDNDNDESCEKPYYRLLYGVEIFNSTFVISIVTIKAKDHKCLSSKRNTLQIVDKKSIRKKFTVDKNLKQLFFVSKVMAA